MPKELEARLRKAASKKGVRDPDAYVYGTLRETGWKPKRERKTKLRKPAGKKHG